MTTLVRGARQLLTLRGDPGPRRGAALRDLGIVSKGAVLIKDGVILEAGPARRIEKLPAARRARSALSVTMIDEPDMAAAAISGVTSPDMASGTAIKL